MTDVPDRYDDYRATVSDPRFTDWLRKRADPDWTNAVDHRFTRELGRGALSEAVFGEYLVQDYAFLDVLVSTFGFAVAQAPDVSAKRAHIEFLDTLTDEENNYFERSFSALGVDDTRWEQPELSTTTAAFVDLFGRTAREGGYAETLAAIVPAEWIYAEWATREASAHEAAADLPFYFADWIELHANPSFEEFVTWLRGQLDAYGPTLSPAREREIERIFCRTVDLEVAFFDDAYAAGETYGEGGQ
ncbi:TenA family protein [Natronomonas amylolytica]|uniref:TenA family protein n=1 Tax=Natronomonas amylolytica TaxID=3108498 RepID=UPI00300AA1A8